MCICVVSCVLCVVAGSVKAMASRGGGGGGGGKPRQNSGSNPPQVPPTDSADEDTKNAQGAQSAPGPERNVANRGSNRSNPY